MGSGTPVRDAGVYQQVATLLEAGRYEQLSLLLGSLRERHGDIALDSMLGAALNISAACAELSRAKLVHRRGYLESRQQMRQMTLELGNILRQISGARISVDKGPTPSAGDRGPAGQPPIAAQHREQPAESSSAQARGVRPLLAIYYLSPFQVYLDDVPLQGWSNGKGKQIFKYLGTRRGQPVAKEILMELFWPAATPQSARNNLNVAVCGLRRTLSRVNPDYSYVLYRDGSYLLNPELQVWIDYQEFLDHFRTGQRHEMAGDRGSACREYRLAEALYQEDFLNEDRYEEWPEEIRQKLRNSHITLLEKLSRFYFDRQDYESCITACNKALLADPCYEDFHYLLMRCYHREGHTHLALRQFHYCREALLRELGTSPGPAIRQIYDQIRTGRDV